MSNMEIGIWLFRGLGCLGRVIYRLTPQWFKNKSDKELQQKIISGSPDILVYMADFEIIRIGGPITHHGKVPVTPYYKIMLQFTDRWGLVRSNSITFLEQILPQSLVDELGTDDGRFNIDGDTRVKGSKFEILSSRVKHKIGNSIEVVQDSTHTNTFKVINPLNIISEDNNNAQEKRLEEDRLTFIVLMVILLVGIILKLIS